MKRESIIRGLARWAGREIRPRLPAFSPARLAVATFERLAATAPAAAEAVAASLFGPVVPAVVGAAGPQFDAVAEALVEAAKGEEKLTVVLAGIPYSLTESDFRSIVDEIRTAEASA